MLFRLFRENQKIDLLLIINDLIKCSVTLKIKCHTNVTLNVTLLFNISIADNQCSKYLF